MAKFKLRPPKPPKRPRITNPMKGVHRARAMFITSLIGFGAILTCFLLYYKSITKEVAKVSTAGKKISSKSKSSQTSPPPEPAGTEGGDDAATESELNKQTARSNRSETSDPNSVSKALPTTSPDRELDVPSGNALTVVSNSPNVKLDTEDPVCFWGKIGIARSRHKNDIDQNMALFYLNKALEYQTKEASNSGCSGNAITALDLLKTKKTR